MPQHQSTSVVTDTHSCILATFHGNATRSLDTLPRYCHAALPTHQPQRPPATSLQAHRATTSGVAVACGRLYVHDEEEEDSDGADLGELLAHEVWRPLMHEHVVLDVRERRVDHVTRVPATLRSLVHVVHGEPVEEIQKGP